MTANKPKVEVKTDEQLAQEFVRDYNILCKRYQRKIVATPVFKARDDNTFSVVIQSSVGKLPQTR